MTGLHGQLVVLYTGDKSNMSKSVCLWLVLTSSGLTFFLSPSCHLIHVKGDLQRFHQLPMHMRQLFTQKDGNDDDNNDDNGDDNEEPLQSI